MMDANELAALAEFVAEGASPERAMAQLQGFTDGEFLKVFGRPINDRPAEQITDAEQLDDLPQGTVLVDANGKVALRGVSGNWLHGHAIGATRYPDLSAFPMQVAHRPADETASEPEKPPGNLIQDANTDWYEGQLFYSKSAHQFGVIDSSEPNGYRLVDPPAAYASCTIIR